MTHTLGWLVWVELATSCDIVNEGPSMRCSVPRAGTSGAERHRAGAQVYLNDAGERQDRVVSIDLFYVIFIDFVVLGVLRFCFMLLSNVQFLVLVDLPPGRSHAGGISSRHSRRQYPFREMGSV